MKVEQYRDEETAGGKPKNQNLIARIDDVRLAALRSLFTDVDDLYPADGQQAWWEVWLRDDRLTSFRTVASRLNVAIKPHLVSFPERDVVLALADSATMARLVANTDAVAELRAPKDTPSFFLDMRPIEQSEWAGDLADRAKPAGPLAPVVCLLDSGATRGHPLIAPGLEADDQHAYDDAWGCHARHHRPVAVPERTVPDRLKSGEASSIIRVASFAALINARPRSGTPQP